MILGQCVILGQCATSVPHDLELLPPQVDVVPSAASLIIKALKEPPRDRKKVKHGEFASW